MDGLAQDTDEGRGKLRNFSARRMQPLNRESLNETSYSSEYSERKGNAGK